MKTIEKEKLFHVGLMDKAARKPNFNEGSGLPVSENPRAWEKIARSFGHHFQLTKKDEHPFRLLDFYEITKSEREVIAQWGKEQNYVEPTQIYVVETTDEEGEEVFEMHFSSIAEVEEEGLEVAYIRNGYAATPLLQETTENPSIDLICVFDMLVTVYAEVHGYDGVWWEEECDVNRLTYARGVIFNKIVESDTTSIKKV